MSEITTDDVYSFFVKQDRALTAREIAAHFSVGRDHVNRLLRKMIEREQRVRSVRINGNYVEYQLAGEPIAVRNHFAGWGNAPRLGLK